jgi:choice-of-anchor B domain-containing protein
MFLPLKSRWVAGTKRLKGMLLFAFGVLALACGISGLRAQIPAELTTGANSWNVQAVDFVGVDAMMTEKVNDIGYWWDDEFGQGYLLEGCQNGTAFLKVLPGGKLVFMGKLPTASVNSIWRDIKVLGHHMYVVSEAPEHGMQVFDLEALRAWNPGLGASVWAADTVLMHAGQAHNLAVNAAANHVVQLGANATTGGALVFDASNPGAPVLAGAAAEWGSFHDAHALRYEGPDVDHVGKDLLFAAGSQKL